MNINLGFNSAGELITPISSVLMSESYINENFPDVTEIVSINYKQVLGMSKPLAVSAGAVVSLPPIQPNGRFLLAGDFIAELPIVMQRKFDDLVMSGDREARVFDRYINTGAGLSTSDPTTIGAVMYLCGQAVPDGDGGTLQLTAGDEIMTVAQGNAWLAGDDISSI